jgi:transcriptional regulator with XRE-family HTH domain
MTQKKPPSTHFGTEVSTLLASASMSQADLARAIGKTANHLGNTLRGTYSHPTASWADLVANALDLPDQERYRLHLAAARDQGFKL